MRSMTTFSAGSFLAGGLLAASCGGELPVDHTARSIEICVDEMNEIVPGGTCGEDSVCRDARGFAIEGTRCIPDPAMCTTTDVEPPVITVHGGSRPAKDGQRGTRVTLEDCGVEIVDTCDGELDLTTAGAEIACVSFSGRSGHHGGYDKTGNHHSSDDCGDRFEIVDSQTVVFNSPGRYVISFTVHDAAGNEASAACLVTVPKYSCNDLKTEPTMEMCEPSHP